MKHHTPSFTRRNVRAYAAAVLSYLLLAGQMAPLVLAAKSTAPRVAPPTDVARESAGEAPRLEAAAAPAPLAAPAAPAAFAPTITATKVDTYAGQPSPATPGTTITYTVTINNAGPDPATNLTLTDTVDPNTTIVPGSAVASPIALDETYSVLGNVRIQPNAANGLLANDNNPNTGNTSGLTASGPTTGPSNGQATVNADGSFSYNPNPGFTGTDSFTYTVTSANGSDTATVTLNVAGMIWFIDDSAAPGGDGRLTSPFNCIVGPTCFDPVAADDPGDNIFVYAGTYTDTAALTLLNNQKVIGQGTNAGTTLDAAAGVTLPPHSDALPALNGDPSTVTVNSAASGIVVTTGNTNTLRGFTLGNNGPGAKIFSTAFATLNVSEVALSGTGQALNLDSGALAATFTSIVSTTSAGQGINLDQITGSLTSSGGTTVTDPLTQGILVTASTADINFGNTTVSDATDAISLGNNSAGTRTFGTITTTGGTGAGFLHANGGGAVNVTGATSITNPGGNGIDIDGSNANISFAATTVNKNSTGGIGVDLTSNASRTIGFSSLAVTTTTGFALNANNSGTVNAGGGSLTQSGAGGGAASLTNTALGLTFTSVSSNGGANGLLFSGGSGTFSSNTTNLQNNAGVGLSMANSAVAASFGNTTVNSSAGDAVDISGQTGNVTFADLDLTPDANLRGLDVATTTGTITSSSGDIATTGAPAVNIAGASAAARTPLSLTLTNVDSTNSSTLGIDLNFVSGNLSVTDPGVATNITNPTGIGIRVQNSGAGTINFGNTSVTGSADTGVVLGVASNGNTGAISFADLDITPDNGDRAFQATHNTGTITTISGTLASVNATAVEITGTSAGSRTPLNMVLTSVSATASSGNPPNGIVLTNVNGPAAAVGFSVIGDNSNTARGGNATGGTIANTTGGLGASSGIGVRLENADEVALRRMQINDHSNFALYALNSSNVTVAFTTISGTNGTSDGVAGTFFTDEAAVLFANMTGAALVDRTKISGGIENNMTVVNDTGTLNRLVIDDTEFGLNNTTLGADSLLIVASGLAANPASTVNVTIEDSDFLGARGDVIQTDFRENGKLDLVMERNEFSNAHTNSLAGGATFAGDGNALTGGVANFTYNIGGTTTVDGNTFRGAVGTAVAIDMGRGVTSGRFRNNTIGVQAIANSGASAAGAGGFFYGVDPGGTNTVLIDNNDIFQYNNHGILLQVGDLQGIPTTTNMTVTNNLVSTPGTAVSTNYNAIHLNHGTVDVPADTTTSCVDILSNDVDQGAKGTVLPNSADIRLRQRQATTVRLPGYAGANNDNTAVQNYLVARNTTRPQPNGAAAANTVGGSPAGGGFIGGAACTQPSNGPVESTTSLGEPGVPPSAEGGGPAFGGGVVAPTSEDTNVTSRPFVSPIRRLVKTQAAQPVVMQQRATASVKAAASLQTKRAPAKGDTTNPAGAAQSIKDMPAKKDATGKKPATSSPSDGPSLNPPVIMGDTLTWNIGTLPANSSVTITFQVTIDSPFTGGSPQVSNQGTVSADGISNVLTDDPSEMGANNPTVTPVLATNIFARDGKEAEPPTGTAPLLFTIALSTPATGAVTVNYSTADGGATPATGGASCAGGVDYVSVTNGSVMFATGEQLRTVAVDICSDGPAEPDETFLLNLTGATGGTILDNQATGTITPAAPAGTTLISELRTFGPGGSNDPNDDFVEIYNNTDSPVTVAASDSSAGWGVYTAATCNSAPLLLGTIPNGTAIPARGHYLLTGSAYSLANYGGTGAAAGNLTMAADLPSNANVAVFSTSDVTNLSTVTRLDAVGFGANTGGAVCDLLREGATAPAVTNNLTLLGQYAVLRDPCGKGGNPNTFGLCPTTGNPKDSNSNASDFFMVDPNGTDAGAGQHLGAAGPENLASPLRRDSTIGIALLDASVAAAAPPNRVRDFTSDPGNNSTHGTLSIRRRFTNNTGSPVTRLRFRIVDISTFSSSNADLRARTAPALVSVAVNDPATCAATGAPSTAPCMAPLNGTTLEEPPAQPNGGGTNSTLSAGTITTGTPLLPGASINLQFLLGIQATGSFKFYFIIEALP